MKRIAVSQRIEHNPATGEWRDALDQRLTRWIVDAGYLPVPVPNTLLAEGDSGFLDAWLAALAPAGIVLSGGNDVGSAPLRDRTEARLLDFGRTHHLPVLGICRGMQFLAVSAGGELVPVSGHVAERHRIAGAFDREVNSYHQYAVKAATPDFVVTARAADGCIEAIRYRLLPWQGWMWHPEREYPVAAQDIEEFRGMMQ